MKNESLSVTFLGVGEACDEKLPNTSILIQSGQKETGSLLLDCGFTVPTAFFAQNHDPDDLSLIWISHFHGDHFFGLPLLLLRLCEENRQKPLRLLGPEGLENKVKTLQELAYPGTWNKLNYEVSFTELRPDQETSLGNVVLKTALSLHSVQCLGIGICLENKKIFYSGDGIPSEEALNLVKKSDLIIHESYQLDRETPGHGNILQSIKLAKQAQSARLALVHIQRDTRRIHIAKIKQLIDQEEEVQVFLPEPGDKILI